MSFNLLTISQAAEYLGVCNSQVRKLIKTEGLPFVEIGVRGKRFRREDLEAWTAARVVVVVESKPTAYSVRSGPPPIRECDMSPQTREILERLRRPRRRRNRSQQNQGLKE